MLLVWVVLLFANLVYSVNLPNNLRHTLEPMLYNKVLKIEVLAGIPKSKRRVLRGLDKIDMTSTINYVTNKEFKNVPEIGKNHLSAALAMKKNGQFTQKMEKDKPDGIYQGATSWAQLVPKLAAYAKELVAANPNNKDIVEESKTLYAISADLYRARVEDGSNFRMNAFNKKVNPDRKATTSDRKFSDDKTIYTVFNEKKYLADNPDKQSAWDAFTEDFDKERGTKNHAAAIDFAKDAMRTLDPNCKDK